VGYPNSLQILLRHLRAGEPAMSRADRGQREKLIRIARGDECPANSGTYCDDVNPICCYVHDQWQSFAKREDCHD
jgi:hypothetical protein